MADSRWGGVGPAVWGAVTAAAGRELLWVGWLCGRVRGSWVVVSARVRVWADGGSCAWVWCLVPWVVSLLSLESGWSGRRPLQQWRGSEAQ